MHANVAFACHRAGLVEERGVDERRVLARPLLANIRAVLSNVERVQQDVLDGLARYWVADLRSVGAVISRDLLQRALPAHRLRRQSLFVRPISQL